MTTIHDNQKVKQFIITKPVLQTKLKGILHTEEEGNYNHRNMGKIDLTKLADEKNEE
jgi:hypothetical protein